MTLCLHSQAYALTWSDVKAKATAHAPSLKSARAEVDASDAAITSANADLLPSISSSIGSSKNIDTGTGDSKNSIEASIALEQSLFSFGRTRAQIDAAHSEKSASIANLRLASATLRAKIAKAWSKTLYLQELVKIGEKNVTRRAANVQIVKLRYQGGRENKGSVLRTEASKLQTQTDAAEAQANLTLSKGELSVLIGQSIDENDLLSGDLIPELIDRSKSKPNEHPQVAAMVAKQRQAEASLREAKRRYLPELSLAAAAKKSASPNLPLGPPQYSAGLTVRVPIFNWATSGDVASASAKSKVAVIAAEEAKASYEQKIKQTESSLEIAQKRLEVSQKIFEASKLQAEVSRQRYTLGLMSFQDWDSYETELMRSEADILRSKLEVANCYADHLEALGISLEEGP